MNKETKKPEVVVGKSALDEFLDEWNAWRGKSKTKKAERGRYVEENTSTAERIRRKRKQQTNFMDLLFMIVINFFSMLINITVSLVVWMFTFVFSFKFWALVGVIIYFSDVDIKTIINDPELKEQAIELKEKAKATFIELKESMDGIEIEIKKTDGSVIKFGGGDDVDVWRVEETPTDKPIGVLKPDE